MKDSDFIRGFHHSGKAWYASAVRLKDVIDSVNFGMYSPEGGTSGEMRMDWVLLNRDVVAKLKCFDDAFEVLASFSDVLQLLKDREGLTADDFCDLLKSCGFKDLTAYTTKS